MNSVTHTERFYADRIEWINKKTKVCIKCGVEKNKSEFTNDRQHRDGKFPICHECKKEMHRNLYKKKPEAFKVSASKWMKNNPEKRRAHYILNYAVKTGRVEKPSVCQECGKVSKRLEGHHWKGYEEKHILDVQWLCHKCHEKK